MPVPAAARQPDPPGVGWFATPLGQRLLRDEQRQVLPLLAGCYGQVGIYLRGCEAASPELAGNMLQKVVKLCCNRDAVEGDLRCEAGALPLLRESVDLVVLMHVIEARASAAPLLAEAERALTPEGTLVLVALNPLSPFRARWAGSGLRSATPAASRGWLRDAGFDLLQQRGLGPVLPWLDEARRDASGRDAFAGLRAGYAMLARKRRPGLTPLRTRPSARPIGAGVPTA